MNNQVDIQKRFFDFVSERHSPEEVLHTTMEVLHLGKGAVYKRMNGTTALTASEMVQLAGIFKISLDNIFQNESYMPFFHPFWKRDNASSIDFVDRFAVYLKPTTGHKSSKITYLANELPINYYFSHKYILHFLISIWNHLHYNEAKLIIDKTVSIDQRMESLRKEIQYNYKSQKVTEIWNPSMLNNLYQQIVFCITMRAFPNADFIGLLLKDIERLLSTLQKVTSPKAADVSPGSHAPRIYLNEFGNFVNILLYDSDDIQSAFIGIDMPHYMITYSPSFVKQANVWVDNIKRRSVLISSEGFQYRELFFHKLAKEYDTFKERVGKLVAVYYE